MMVKAQNLNIAERVKTSAEHSKAISAVNMCSNWKILLTALPASPLSPLGPGPPSIP